MSDPLRIPRVVGKLQTVWSAHPNKRLGQIVEAVENIGWTILFEANPQISHSTRFCNLGDDVFEEALNQVLTGRRDLWKELYGT